MDFQELSELILPELKFKIESNKGLAIFAKERAKFEGWLKVTLCEILANHFLDVLPEKNWIDLTFQDWAIELKTVNTNIIYKNVRTKHRPITKNVEGVIKDIIKLTKTNYTNKSVLFIVFPIEHDEPNWQNHLKKIEEKLVEIKHLEFKFRDKIFGTIYFGKIGIKQDVSIPDIKGENEMNKQVMDWMKLNQNKILESPRKKSFRKNPQDFKIINVDEQKQVVKFEFQKKGTILPLEFWRFEIALDYITLHKGEFVRLGTRFDSEDPATVEYQIQKRAKQRVTRKIDLKSAPHVCDVLVLSGLAEYGYALNPLTERDNQAIKILT